MQRRELQPRPDWVATAERLGFDFHTIDGAPYWDESACYAFSLAEIEDRIEAPTQELHAMALDLVDAVLRDDELLGRLAIPETYWDWIAESWRARSPHLYGRMDLGYDGHGTARLYELNYDTPTALYEAAYFQWLWLEEQKERGGLPPEADQYNLIQESLIEAFGTIAKRLPRSPAAGKAGPGPLASAPRDPAGAGRVLLYFSAVRESREDFGTITYLRDCAEQAGIATAAIAIEDIGLAGDGRFVDLEGRPIGSLFKLYPLEFLFAEEFGRALPGSGITLLEPPWKAVLSNKGILPLLWERHRGHPNLLPAVFEATPDAPLPAGWVRKPLYSREGANIDMHLSDGRRLVSAGPYEGPAIQQACHLTNAFAGRFPVLGSWVIGDRAVGLGVREDDGRITRDSSRFVPHVILG
jgi:glutathionylspermidine synthase